MQNNKKMIFFTCNLVLIFIISLFAHLARPINTSQVVFIPQGGTSEIISYLSSRNFNISTIDKYVLVLIGHVQAGWVQIGYTRLSKLDFLYKLTKAKAAMRDITLLPGETSEYFLYEISKNMGLNYTKLLSQLHTSAPIKEGFLVPETYKIPLGISESHFIYYLVNLSKKAHEDRAKKIFGAFDEKRWYEYIIIASIIQKEAANEVEMPLVASVIYNRLKKGMPLQMDGTLNYGLHSHERITAARIKSDNSRYNTYKYAGLPSNAICNPSLAAIKAAIFPKKSDYLYFVRDKATGVHKFSVSYDQHTKAVNKNK